MVLAQNQTYSSVDRIENLEINTHIYGQLIYERIKNIQWRKESVFNKW